MDSQVDKGVEPHGSKKIDTYIPNEREFKKANDLLELLVACSLKEIGVSVAGGYGLDGLYGRLTRDHEDYDLIIADEGLDPFEELIISKGYLKVDTNSQSSRKYYHPELPKIEVGSMSAALDLTNLSPEDLMPGGPNANLLGKEFKVPDLEGQKAIISIQDQRRQEEGWSYPIEKIINRNLILDDLQRRMVIKLGDAARDQI